MSAASVSSSVRLPDFARTTTFRWTLAVAGAFVLCTLLLFGFVYWQTAAYMTSKIDVLLTEELRLFAHPLPSGEVLVIGRNIDEIADIAGIVGRALALGLLPAFGLAVAIGVVLSL